jgi:hypothetical protein
VLLVKVSIVLAALALCIALWLSVFYGDDDKP